MVGNQAGVVEVFTATEQSIRSSPANLSQVRGPDHHRANYKATSKIKVKSPEGEELDMVLKELDNLETDSARIIREITAEQKYELGMAYQHRFRWGRSRGERNVD